MSRLATAVLLAGAAVLLAESPAAADPAGPSDYRSEVTGLVPETDVVDAEIRGGDSFLQLSVEEGHTVIVFGYEDGDDGDGKGNDPYLRFNPDGTVERNRLSTATYLNEDRLGDVQVPEDATGIAPEPDWEQVADGGTYAWHDHRIHWMGGSTSPGVERGELVAGFDPWVVPISVDGNAVDVEGTLTYAESVSPLPWIAVGLVAAGLLAWFGRRSPLAVASGALTLVAAVAVVVGRADVAASPAGSGENPLLWILPTVALGAAVPALFLSRRAVAVVLALAAVASLAGWALLRLRVLLDPVLPTDLSPSLDRLSVVLALATAAAAAYLAVTSGALTLPELDDD